MAVQTKEHVMTIFRTHHARIRALGVKRLGLFGSFLHGQPNRDSDVDVLVEFMPGCKTFDNFIELVFVLEALFDRRVELVTPESLVHSLVHRFCPRSNMSRSMLGFLQHILNETQYLMDLAEGVAKGEFLRDESRKSKSVDCHIYPVHCRWGVRPRLLPRKPTVFCMCPYSGT